MGAYLASFVTVPYLNVFVFWSLSDQNSKDAVSWQESIVLHKFTVKNSHEELLWVFRKTSKQQSNLFAF